MKHLLLFATFLFPSIGKSSAAPEKIVLYFLSTSDGCTYEERVVEMGIDKVFDRIRAEFDGQAKLKCFPAARLKSVMRESKDPWITWGAVSWYQNLAFNYEKSLPIYRYSHRIAVKNHQWKSLDDLKNGSIATIRGYTFPKVFNDKLAELSIKLQYVESTDSCIGMVMLARASGCLQGAFELRDSVASLKAKPNLKYLMTGPDLPEESVYILSSPKIDKASYERMNRVIRGHMPHVRRDSPHCCE